MIAAPQLMQAACLKQHPCELQNLPQHMSSTAQHTTP